jgi:16S rRNA C967 or C1407 C5-methylase (RsmB/RsmF family)
MFFMIHDIQICAYSLTKSQNEDIIENFLSSHSTALLQPIDILNTDKISIKDSISGNCISFHPIKTRTSGFFIAKINKIS